MGRVVTNYVSDHTTFINELMKKNPQWQEDQATGRAIWWDKAQTVEQQQRSSESAVAAKPYPYDVNF